MKRFLSVRLWIVAGLMGGCTVVSTDIDGDGILDDRDACPRTRLGEPIDARGCSILDDDNDGVLNDMDGCITPAGEAVNSRGCPFVDSDGDGIDDEGDVCRSTAPGEPVNAVGCSTLDDDGDGVGNDMDQCVSQPGDIVDGTGCLRDEGVGTLSGEWLINGFPADAVSCANAGIRDVRFNVDARDGSDSASWTMPCENGFFDSSTAADEPTISFYVAYTSFWEALDSTGAVVASTTPLDLQLNNPPTHAIVVTPDFPVDLVDILTVPLAWETDYLSGIYGTCDEAMVDRGITIMIYFAGGVTPFAEFIDGACGQEVIIHSDDYPDFGPGSYEMDISATAFDGTKWGAACNYEFDGGIATAPTCFIPVVP